MILRFFSQPDSPHSQIFRKAGQKKAEPNMPHMGPTNWLFTEFLIPSAAMKAVAEPPKPGPTPRIADDLLLAIPSQAPGPSRRQGTRLPSHPVPVVVGDTPRHAHARRQRETRGQLFGAPFQCRVVPCWCACACAQLILGQRPTTLRRRTAPRA
jgi:hypothetical protein